MKVSDFKHETRQVAGVFGRSKEVRVIFEGDQAYTDGSEIVLPALDESKAVKDELIPVMRGYLDHEAGHVRHTDFDTFQKWRKGVADSWGHVHNCLEDMWLERRVMEEYPGAEKNFSSLTNFVNKKEVDYHTSDPSMTKDVNVNSVCLGILQEGRKNYPGLEHNATLESFLPEQVKKWKSRWIEEVHKCKNTGEVINLTKEIAKLLKDDPSLDSEPEAWEPDVGSGDPTDAGECDKGEEQEGFAKSDAKKWVDPNKYAVDELGGSGLTKDTHFGGEKAPYKVVTDRWDTVWERGKGEASIQRHRLITKANKSDYDEQVAELQSHVNVMRSKLRRAIAAKDRRDWDVGRENGRLDSKRLVAAYQRSPSVYKLRKDKEEINTAIQILIDLSGSMYGNKMSIAAATAIALNECLAGSGVRYQISGFSNFHWCSESQRIAEPKGKWHRIEPLVITKYKSWDESLHDAKEAMSTLRKAAGGNNADTCAVDWAYRDLTKQEAKRKILMVLSDGSPACYTSSYSDDLDTPLVEKVQDIIKAGIEVIGIGMMSDSVTHFYPKNVVVRNMSELSGEVFNQLSKILVDGKVRL